MSDADILDRRDSVTGYFIAALLLHASVVGGMAIYGWIASHTVSFGDPKAGGASVGIEAVNTIPIPHKGEQNPLANETPSQVPQEITKPEERVKKEPPPPDAIAVKSLKLKKKEAKVASESQRFRPPHFEELPSVTSKRAPQVSSQIFSEAPGSGKVGTGTNTTLGDQFAGYAQQIRELVARKWNTGDINAASRAPIVIATFDLMRDGSIRNLQLLQTSGISALDFSVRRAIQDASPFPPIPSAFAKDHAKVEFSFELKR